MKISVLQENLSRGLTTVSRLVASKAALPILGNVLLKTDKGRLKLSATNLETGISLFLGAKIEKEGEITVPARILVELVSSLLPEKVDLEATETTLHLSSGSFKADISGISASEFPKIPSFQGEPAFLFDKEELIKILSQVSFAAAQDESRPVLTGVLLRGKIGKTLLVATDGYRLSVKNLAMRKQKEEKDLLIPAKTLIEVCRIAQEAQDEEKEIKMALNSEKNQVLFSFSQKIELSSRLLEGEFPDFEKIIPPSFSTKAEFDKEEFLRAVKIASIFAREQANIVKIKIEGGKMIISAESPQVGANQGEIEAKTEGEKLEIAFNFRFLLDFLNSPIGEEIIFEANGPLSPGVFKVKGDDSFLHLIMPVRIQA
ncbi:DNA polymerase III subunit beta [Candidatus Shapirobacteria bacterium CG10_big_fil_rev_8_21_14_0_10_40_9]|uniref:Beta sliding clamp n=1 Tax=Candidatus Shapirobacteria bacterium CG10_big_fil_rev_8_21_14_0_10_40_9 TaxID=1974888 RepID=A0A2M8L3H0_9BACT|nr:MAG: DNA polymerase III subunit beta [Candidatus Shapirobacteria bacterium CG10_big_fil_rev_8_21_14_0_10_40_9]